MGDKDNPVKRAPRKASSVAPAVEAAKAEGSTSSAVAPISEDAASDLVRPDENPDSTRGSAPGNAGAEVEPGAGTEAGTGKPVDATSKKPSEQKELPQDNGYSEIYDWLYEEAKTRGKVDEEGNCNDPFFAVGLLFCTIMSKYGSFMDSFVPGAFKDSLDKTPLASENFDKSDLDNLNTPGSDEFKPEDYANLNPSQASLKYGCKRLNVKEASSVKVLAARLHHCTAYQYKDWDGLNAYKVIPRGTVIFFSETIGGDLLSAYATGDKKTFSYYKPSFEGPKTFELGSDDAPIKNAMQLKGAFVRGSATVAEAGIDTPEMKLNDRVVDVEKKINSSADTIDGLLQATETNGGESKNFQELDKVYVAVTKDFPAIEACMNQLIDLESEKGTENILDLRKRGLAAIKKHKDALDRFAVKFKAYIEDYDSKQVAPAKSKFEENENQWKSETDAYKKGQLKVSMDTAKIEYENLSAPMKSFTEKLTHLGIINGKYIDWSQKLEESTKVPESSPKASGVAV